MRLDKLFRLATIVGTLPVTLTNGTTADATQVMADLNWIVNQINANAANIADVALLASANNFTALQSGIAATQPANFPIASQVQGSAFNTLTSTLGTNTITARVVNLTLTAYAKDLEFGLIPSQTNTGASAINIDSLGSIAIQSNGLALVGGELRAGQPTKIRNDGSFFQIIGGASVLLAGALMDSTVTFKNANDQTKQAQFNLSSVVSGVTAHMRVPPGDSVLLAANLTNQTITGGATVPNLGLPTGSFTLDHRQRPLMTIANNGAFTIIGSGVADGYSNLLITNTVAAGNVTFSGFTVGVNSGDSLTSTNGNKFLISLMTIGGISTFQIKSLQSS